MSQYKNSFLFSGALLHMEPQKVSSYTHKGTGELIEKKERIIYIRNKVSKFNRWHIVDAEFHCTGSAVESLEMIRVGEEVVASFSINVVNWTDKTTGEHRRWQKLSCFSIISPRNAFKSEAWWQHNNGDPVRTKTKEDEPVEKLTHLEQKRKNPPDVEYDIKSYDKGTDYSHDNSEPIVEKPVPKKKEVSQEIDLPF